MYKKMKTVFRIIIVGISFSIITRGFLEIVQSFYSEDDTFEILIYIFGNFIPSMFLLPSLFLDWTVLKLFMR